MKCAYHGDKDAVGVCVSCGTGLCSDCRNVERGAMYCEECIKRHEPMRVFPGRTGMGTNVWAVIAWVLAVAGWWPNMQFLAVAAVVLGFVALGDMRAHGYTQRGKSYAWAAILIAAVSLAFYILLIFFYLRRGLELSPWLNPFNWLG